MVGGWASLKSSFRGDQLFYENDINQARKNTKWKFELMFCHLFSMHHCCCETKAHSMKVVNQR